MIAQAILGAIGFFSGGKGGNSGAANATDGPGRDLFRNFAMGGVFGGKGEMPLKRYARGGIATRPQIALFGEGDTNEAYVPLPDGRSIPVTLAAGGKANQAPNINFNVINESGIPMEAEQQGPATFDGERFVLDVVLKAVNRPGNFRDGMKGAIRR
jgi:hypothetical protein